MFFFNELTLYYNSLTIKSIINHLRKHLKFLLHYIIRTYNLKIKYKNFQLNSFIDTNKSIKKQQRNYYFIIIRIKLERTNTIKLVFNIDKKCVR